MYRNTHTYALTNTCTKMAHFWSLFFILSFFNKYFLINNLNLQQQIVRNFWPALCNWKTHQIHTCPLETGQQTLCEVELPHSMLSARPETISSRFFYPVLSVMWNGEWGNNETTANFPQAVQPDLNPKPKFVPELVPEVLQIQIPLMNSVYNLAFSYYLTWRSYPVFTNYMLQTPCHAVFIKAK